MSDKNLEDMDFAELLQLGLRIDLDGIVQGKALKSRVYALLELGAHWNEEKNRKKK